MSPQSNKESMESACRDLINQILSNKIKTETDLTAAKKKISISHKLKGLPSNPDILACCSEEEKQKIIDALKKKPVRTISGVAVLAAMTSPSPCPHGRCIPCPGGPKSRFKTPQSYIGLEPAARRAIQQGFDPYGQVAHRLKQLAQIGHPIDKAELIIMGGTFTARPISYQKWFIKGCIEAMNDYGKSPRRPEITLEQAQKANETARIRNVGITIETRPDWAKEEQIDILLKIGATKVELGVQSLYDSVLARIKRGHTVAESIAANKRLRDSGLKVGFHMMPGLPGSNPEKDLSMFKRLFNDQEFKPDYLKIYPTLITEGTELEDMWKHGQYEPLGTEEAVELIAKIKALLPRWVRLQRIQRDIPANQVKAGIKKSNIRQLALEKLAREGKECRCIRCREVGHRARKGTEPKTEDIALLHEAYEACGGEEHFLSFEDKNQNILIGFLRLRFPMEPHRPELKDAALVRDLHVYGPTLALNTKPEDGEWQHRGYGKELLAEAEKIAREEGYRRIAITSGIGVREYYRRLGYADCSRSPAVSPHIQTVPYMLKKL